MQSPNARTGRNLPDRDKLMMLSDTKLAFITGAVKDVVDGTNSKITQADFQHAIDEIGQGTIRDYRKTLKMLGQEARRRDRERGMVRTIPWTPFERSIVDPAQLFTPAATERFKALVLAAGSNQTWEEMRDIYVAGMKRREVFLNSRYQVELERANGMIHLSIKRKDQQPVHDWRDLQRIKNELVGPECEGVELYPAESRCVDTANQYHLWVVDDPTHRFEIGWNEGRLVMDEGEADGVGQRKFEQ